jgi:hypothetical protein
MSLTQSLSLTIDGNKATPAEVRLTPTSARTTKYSYAGWEYRRRYTITNNTGNALSNYPYALDLGTTNGLVSGGKALSTGNDLRVTIGGVEVARTLVNWNDGSFATLAWIVIPDLANGQALTCEVIYGNASAGAPPTLAYPELPAFDITTAGTNRSTNAKWVYNVSRTAANKARGGWWIERGDAQPGSSDTSIPGAWRPVLTLNNAIDDIVQPRWSSYTDTLVYYQGRFDASRARDGSIVGSEVMDADGVMIEVPAGITSVRCDLEVQNQTITSASAERVGQIVIAGRNGDTGDWAAFYTNTTGYASNTTVTTATYTPSANMRQVAFAVWPYNGVAVPASATTGRVAAARWNTVLEVNIASAGIAFATSMAETACYDMTSALQLERDGTQANVIRSQTKLGNFDQGAGAGTPRLMVALNEVVIVDGNRFTAQVWSAGAAAKVEDVPADCIGFVETAVDYQNATATRTAYGPLDLYPVANPLANPTFATDATGWSRLSATAGVTAAAIARSTAQFTTTPASGTVVVSANTAGAGAEVVDGSDLLSLGTMRAVSVALDARSTATTVVMRPAVYWYDSSGNYVSRAIGDDYVPVANTWYRRVVAGTAPLNATQYRVGLVTFARNAGSTGTVFVDTITVNANELQFRDPDGGGSVSVSVSWAERYA